VDETIFVEYPIDKPYHPLPLSTIPIAGSIVVQENEMVYGCNAEGVKTCTQPFQEELIPPSTDHAAPVVNNEASEAKKSTTLATSSGLPKRPTGYGSVKFLKY